MSLDCDDVVLLLAASERPTLSGAEERQLEDHIASCETCQRLRADVAEEDWRWIARVPEEALADPDLLVLPTVDPIVFEHREELASGGMGRISRVHDRRLGRDVAVKEMLEPDMRARFEREAMITARLQHPAIVPIYEAGTWPDGSAFYTMRLVPGGTLAAAIEKAKTLEARLALLRHVIAATEALAYAHSRGVIHRDLKPSNILVGEFGETVVIDWGLAKHVGEPESGDDHDRARAGLTIVGTVLGTPGFMSPEQTLGEPLDERADVFALGSILYHVLAGSPPYWDEAPLRDNSDMLLSVSRERAPSPLEKHAPDAPADLRAIVKHAMARRKQDRYATAKEMAAELRRFEAGQLLASREYRVRDLLGRWIRRHRTAVIVGTIAAIVLAVVGVVAIRNVTHSRTIAEESRTVAVTNLAALLEEQGRTESLAGDRQRALAYLAEASRLGRDTPALRHLLASASVDLDLAIPSDPADADAFAFTDTNELVVHENSGPIAIWSAGQLIGRHELGVSNGWLSPNATRYITDEEEAMVMWDPIAGKRLWSGSTLKDANRFVFDTPAKRVAIFADAFDDLRDAQIRDAATGDLLATLPGPTTDVAFLGDLVASCTEDGAIRVFDLANGKLVSDGNTGAHLQRLRFVDDNTLVATTTERGGLLLWNRVTSLAKPLTGHTAEIHALDVSPRARVIASADEIGAVRLWSRDGEPLAAASDARSAIGMLKFSPSGALLAAVGSDRFAYVWEASSLDLRRAIATAANGNNEVGWSPDGAQLVTLPNTIGPLQKWRTPEGARVVRLPSKFSVASAHRVAMLQAQTLAVHDVITGHELTTIDLPFPPLVTSWAHEGRELQLSRDGARALVTGRGKVTTIDLDTGAHREWDAIPGDTRPESRLSADGRFVVEDAGATLRAIDAATGRVLFQKAVDGSQTVVVAPDGAYVLALFDKSAIAWQLPSGDEIPFVAPDEVVTAMVDRTGKQLLVEHAEDDHRIYEVGTARQLGKLATPSDIHLARFDANGDRVIAWCEDRSARIFDSHTGAQLAFVDGVAESAIAISDDGARFATGHDDGTLRVWDSTGRLLQTIHAHRRNVLSLAFVAEDTRLVSHGDDGYTSIYDVHLDRRSPAEIADLAARLPWHFAHGQLVHR